MSSGPVVPSYCGAPRWCLIMARARAQAVISFASSQVHEHSADERCRGRVRSGVREKVSGQGSGAEVSLTVLLVTLALARLPRG